jgi:hypothetical protein
VASFIRQRSAYQMFLNVRYQIESGYIAVPLWYDAACLYQPRQKLAPARKQPVMAFELEGRLLKSLVKRHPDMNSVA